MTADQVLPMWQRNILEKGHERTFGQDTNALYFGVDVGMYLSKLKLYAEVLCISLHER